MKYLVLLILFLTSSNAFSQEKKLSYYFDSSIAYKYKKYSTHFNGKMIHFINTKDSTYSLLIKINDTIKKAILDDHKKKIIINFDANFDYNKIEDLNKLSNSKLYTEVIYEKQKQQKNIVENFEYENDSINKQILVHITNFKDKKKKKIITEHYYYFSNKENIISSYKNNVKEYILKKYNLLEIKNLNLEKILCLVDGKIDSETIFLDIRPLDFKFDFPIDDVYPKFKMY